MCTFTMYSAVRMWTVTIFVFWLCTPAQMI
uniref:Uncharacterized protein n=1 Tax=Anguilla anguilla TaxID=7936 RepID=A0A0E9T9H1_ANGAN